MMLFQELEYLFKILISNGSFSGYASEAILKNEKRAAIINKHTLGQLVGHYLEISSPEYQELDDDPDELDEAFFSFKFQTKCEAVYFETKKDVLTNIVSERNELVHHLLPKLDKTSVESCIQIGKMLDDQREKILPEIIELRQKLDYLQEGKKLLIDFLSSDEGKKQFELSWLRQSRLVLLLGDIAIQTARPDGWALMNIAAKLVREYAPEEIASLKDRYGHKSLKALILATEIFDLFEEPTDKGFRILYRIKSGWKLSTV